MNVPQAPSLSYSEVAGKEPPEVFQFDVLPLCLFFKIFINLLAMLGCLCCVQAFSSCNKQGPLSIVVLRLLIVVVSLVMEHGL